MCYQLGTIEASEQLIRDLYINLRNQVNAWSEITQQTPQARMGYIGQHLVSVVTGYPGGKSGARGYDLVMEDGAYGEIKTCYRVDQLGKCKRCGAVVSSLETECSVCHSRDIERKDDSKWLIGIQHDQEFSEVSDPKRYYFVLFEFEDLNDPDNNNILAKIWEVDPKEKGFGYCMIDYYLNIKSHSQSGAPFNMWPYSLKFALTNPKLIYKSRITSDGNIETLVFPSGDEPTTDEDLLNFDDYSSAKWTVDDIETVIKKYNPSYSAGSKAKKAVIRDLEQTRVEYRINASEICESIAEVIYEPKIARNNRIPESLLAYFNALR